MAPHLTLVPPVNVAADRLDEVGDLLRCAADMERPFSVTLGPPATFLPANPVLYLRVGGDAALEPVRRLREAVFVTPLARELPWPFTPHVTLMDGGDPARIEAGVMALAGHLVEVTFDILTLLHEQRDADGVRVWRPLLDAPLGGPSVVARGGLPLELTAGGHLDAGAAAWFDASWDAHDRVLSGAAWAPAEPVSITARRDGQVVGVATGAFRDGEAHLERLIVDPAVRGEGIGGHLLAAYTSDVAARGASRLVLRAVAGGDAQRFYVDRGFVTVATLPRWRRGVDFVLLERALR